MEKKTATYDLEGFRQEFTTVASFRMTRTAQNRALALGIGLEEVVLVVQSLKRSHFFKSMTSHRDHRIRQDAYRVPWEGLVLYEKLTVDDLGRLILSLKEK